MVDNSYPNPPDPFSEVTKPTTKRTGLLCDGASPGTAHLTRAPLAAS